MNDLGTVLRVLVVIGAAVVATAAMYLVAGLSVGAWLTHERSVLHAWLGGVPAWNPVLVAAPALIVGCLAARVAMGVRARRRPLEA